MALFLPLAMALVLSHGQADAKCARAQENWSLSEGQAIPAAATLYYFAPSWSEVKKRPKVTAMGAALKSEWTQVSKNEGHTTYRLRFDAGDAKSVAITIDGSTQTHPVDAWTAPKEGRVSGTVGRREQSAWTCSHTDIVPVKVRSKAQAFRVAWFDLRNGVIDFGSGSSIFPRSAKNFWRYGVEKPQKHASFELGHPNCFGYNVPSKNLDAMQVTVTPLYRDGSEGKAVVLRPAKRQAQPEAPKEEAPAVPVQEMPVALPVSTEKSLPAMSNEKSLPAVDMNSQGRSHDEATEALVLSRAAEAPALISSRLWAIALILGTLFGLLIFRSHRHRVSTTRLLCTGAVVSLACGALAWAATLVCFPFWLLFAAGGVIVLYGAARYLERDEEQR